MAKLEIRGDEPLIRALQTAANLEAHKAIVKKHGSKLQTTAQRRAVFTKGYATGATKRRIELEITDGGFTARVEAETDYSGYLEKGTRQMDAQPFMRPALTGVEPQFIEDLRRAGIVK